MCAPGSGGARVQGVLRGIVRQGQAGGAIVDTDNGAAGTVATPAFYESDNSTTKGQVFDAEKYVGTPKDKIVLGGHIGLFMGSRTLKDAWPRIAPWIAGC